LGTNLITRSKYGAYIAKAHPTGLACAAELEETYPSLRRSIYLSMS